MSEFVIYNTALGETLHQLKQGVSTTQTPLVLLDAGPFFLTGDQFETILQSGLVLGGVSAQPPIIILPPTQTMINVIGYLAVNASTSLTGTNITPAAWVQFQIINTTANTVHLTANDGNTSIFQQNVDTQSTQTFVITNGFAPGTVVIYQQVWSTPRVQPSFVSVTYPLQFFQMTGGTLYTIVFDTVLNQSATNPAVTYNVFTNVLSVSAGVTCLVNFDVILELGFSGSAHLMVTVSLAPAGQGGNATPPTGLVTSTTVMVQDVPGNDALVVASGNIVYTNTTGSTSSLQLYVSNNGTQPSIIAAYSEAQVTQSALSAVQIA
jgi:hypothetical protein